MEECHDRYDLMLRNKTKKPSFFGKTRFLPDISRQTVGNRSDNVLNNTLQGDEGSCPQWCQHRSDIFRQLQIMFPLEVGDALVVVTEYRDDIYPHRLGNSQI